MTRGSQPRAQAERHPPAFTVPQHAHRAGHDTRMCLQHRHRSGGICCQVIDRGRGPVAVRPAGPALVIGQHRHPCPGQMVTQDVEEPPVAPVRRTGAANQHHAGKRRSRAGKRDGPAQPHTGTREFRIRPAILARLEAEGRLRPAKNPGYMPQRLHPVTGADPNPLTRALLEERESER